MKSFFYNITTGQPGKLVAPCLASFLEGVARILPAFIIYRIVDLIYQSFALGAPLDTWRLWTLTAIACGWLIVLYITSLVAYDKNFTAAYETSAKGRAALGEHLRKLPLGFFDRRDPADLSTMMLGGYDQIEHTVSHLVPQLVSGLIFPVIFFFLLLGIDVKMALALFAGMPLALLIFYGTTKLQNRLSRSHVLAKVDVAGRLQEYLSGIKEIKAHNLTGESFERLCASFANLMRESIRLEGIAGPIVLGSILLINAGLPLIIFVGSYLLVDGELTLPIFILFLLLGSRVFSPLTVVLSKLAELRYASHGATRIMEVMAEPYPSGTEKPPQPADEEEHLVTFDRVSFGYNKEMVLKDFTLAIPRNKITALVGPSGSGKSTVTRLIARFYDPQIGAVRLAGKDTKEIAPEELLKQVSMVFQDVYLFQDTIGANIRVGNQEATREQVEEAARRACCHDFITALPEGYETPVGEGGATLSGGEKQRISIARAFLKEAPLILLDEATASLDPENENKVQQAIAALIKDKTVVIIAHRLKTVMKADTIAVLEAGRLAEQGNHQSLLEKDGLYARLWNLQMQSVGWSVG